MYGDLFYDLMKQPDLTEKDVEELVRIEDNILTDEQIFVISEYLNRCKSVKIFFTKQIGDSTVSARFFDIVICYDFKINTGETRSTIEIDFQNKTLYVYYSDGTKLEIFKNLLDYSEDKKNLLIDLRMRVVNEMMIRYYVKLLYAIYCERRRNNELGRF